MRGDRARDRAKSWEEIDWMIVEINGKHHQPEIYRKNFHDIKKDGGEMKK
jgi:hypothetical protein